MCLWNHWQALFMMSKSEQQTARKYPRIMPSHLYVQDSHCVTLEQPSPTSIYSQQHRQSHGKGGVMALPPTSPWEGLHILKERTQGQLLQLWDWIFPSFRQALWFNPSWPLSLAHSPMVGQGIRGVEVKKLMSWDEGSLIKSLHKSCAKQNKELVYHLWQIFSNP